MLISPLLIAAAFALPPQHPPVFFSQLESLNPPPVGVFQPALPDAQRSACPCMNSLSNHGFLRRDGGNNTRESIKKAFLDQLNIGEDIGDFFLNGAFGFGMGEGQNETLRLGALNAHGQIEHDVSLVRDDLYFHNDIFSINQTLVQQLLSKSSDGGKSISLGDLGRFRKERFQDSKARNPQLTFGATQQFGAFGEGALLLATFGRKDGFFGQIKMPVNQVEQFLAHERFADDFRKRDDTIHFAGLASLIAQLKLAAGIFSS